MGGGVSAKCIEIAILVKEKDQYLLQVWSFLFKFKPKTRIQHIFGGRTNSVGTDWSS